MAKIRIINLIFLLFLAFLISSSRIFTPSDGRLRREISQRQLSLHSQISLDRKKRQKKGKKRQKKRKKKKKKKKTTGPSQPQIAQ